jgi:lysozyme
VAVAAVAATAFAASAGAAVTSAAVTTSAAAAVEGIDVYNGDGPAGGGPVDWSKVRAAGLAFAIIKSSEGNHFDDASYPRNLVGAKGIGIIRGAYHFARPDTTPGDAVAEARHFVTVAGTFNHAGDLPPALDLEDTTTALAPAALVAWARAFLVEVERLTGRVPILYTYPDYWRTRMGNSREFGRYPLWYAHPGATAPVPAAGWPTYTFWQNTGRYRIPGIAHDLDHEYFHGTRAQLARLADGTVPPHTAEEVCGAGYRVIDRQALPQNVATVYLLYNVDTGFNCVATIKRTQVGVDSPVSAYLQVGGQPRHTDRGPYGYYAGPVRAAARGACVRWGGSAGSLAYDSPLEHCG